MWQRFTERARRVVLFAQEEAGRLGNNFVSTEHLLLGLLRENDSMAVRILERLGVSQRPLFSEIERQIARGAVILDQKVVGIHDIQFTPRANWVMDLAYEEARQLSNKYIGTEHVLIGLIREGEGVASRMLVSLGVNPDRARAIAMSFQDGDPTPVSAPETASRVTVPQEERTAELSEALAAMPPMILPGSLGVAHSPEGRSYIEVANDALNFLQLCDVYRAKDAYGYRAMLQGNQTVFAIPTGTPLKLLLSPPGGRPAEDQDGIFVRVLDGDYAGYAGWTFSKNFAFTGPDHASFPPPLTE